MGLHTLLELSTGPFAVALDVEMPSQRRPAYIDHCEVRSHSSCPNIAMRCTRADRLSPESKNCGRPLSSEVRVSSRRFHSPFHPSATTWFSATVVLYLTLASALRLLTLLVSTMLCAVLSGAFWVRRVSLSLWLAPKLSFTFSFELSLKRCCQSLIMRATPKSDRVFQFAVV